MTLALIGLKIITGVTGGPILLHSGRGDIPNLYGTLEKVSLTEIIFCVIPSTDQGGVCLLFFPEWKHSSSPFFDEGLSKVGGLGPSLL